jgi:ABC-type Fe3+-siderophore transport system permease subunit
MIKSVLAFSCLMASYFVVFFVLSGYWGQALMTAILGSVVFSTTLLAASVFSQGQPWRAFWIANIALISIFGGGELYAALTLTNSHADRFGGAPLWINGRITAAGVASITFDVAMCTLSNFIGFYVSRLLVERLNIESATGASR